MKELTIEQKAKRYDEALKVLHKYDGANIMFSQSLKEEMFPELKEESEDERIRKALISVLKSDFEKDTTIHGITVNDILAWLEKQGGQKTIKEHNICDFCEEEASCINPCPMKLVEKQGEKKSAWSEEDERHLNSILKRTAAFGDSSIYGLIKDDINWLKSIKDRLC